MLRVVGSLHQRYLQKVQSPRAHRLSRKADAVRSGTGDSEDRSLFQTQEKVGGKGVGVHNVELIVVNR